MRAANTGRSASALEAPSVSDIGLTHKDIHEARQLRDAGPSLAIGLRIAKSGALGDDFAGLRALQFRNILRIISPSPLTQLTPHRLGNRYALAGRKSFSHLVFVMLPDDDR
ncbi:hypothetical protein [Ancylobacter polymorphus]|uniref:Uncharacterized protein n=1 Tax=Ancylobacter polymorphus TaxID=223390 RepID=A0A9E6ZZX9_9HYPH|nr:hypothetical protein [Ancylobacter polymorphus]UOK70435.1 hypothetical protein K9D25_17135 [Ancylobacter polymorphus]